MIINGDKYFILNTNNTTYAIRLMPTGHLEHMYYGKRIRVSHSLDGLYERQEFMSGNNNTYSADYPYLTLNNICLEASFEGKGDNREAFAVIINHDGSRTSDFVYESSVVDNIKSSLKTLPSSYGADENEEVLEGESNHLQIVLKDKDNDIKLYLDYYVFEKEDVITRTARLENNSEYTVTVERLMSAQIDIQGSGYVMSTFNGTWAREMQRKIHPLYSGKYVNSSYTGTSSSSANPFFMIADPYATEDAGSVYGFNLIYSGNHYESAEVNEFNKTRIIWGINPRGFSWKLEPKAEFEAPEAVMTFSDKGFNGMSYSLHNFILNHIIRPEFSRKERPVLLNSWEASYFDINEKKLLKLAKAGSNVGIELFVMDDGWFGKRNDDSSSLGDWSPNKAKLPNGIKGLADKINKLGMSFGIWVEPEMVNVDSDLYRAHPDWAVQIPDRAHSEGRKQRILDLSRTDVQDYIIDSMSRVFSSANIEYVKWDMNRTFTDIYSSALMEDGGSSSYNRQGELLHRYVMGLYRCMKVLTDRFRNILFEGCASGGNRFDLGILRYFPQIWGSDNTDAIVRADIQTGYSYGYPQSCWGSHVSGVPNHQTLRVTPLETRFAVASFGSLGYECNLCDMTKEELEKIKQQIETYKEYRDVFQFGHFYRGRSFMEITGEVIYRPNNNITEWTVVSDDRKKAVGMIVQKSAAPNNAYQYYKPAGLDDNKYYRLYNKEIKINIKEFGDLVNSVAPIHIKTGSLTQDIISRFYKLDGEKEDLNMFGSAMMNAGIKLSPAYAGTGFNNKTRVFSDYSSRIYFIEEIYLENI